MSCYKQDKKQNQNHALYKVLDSIEQCCDIIIYYRINIRFKCDALRMNSLDLGNGA